MTVINVSFWNDKKKKKKTKAAVKEKNIRASMMFKLYGRSMLRETQRVIEWLGTKESIS